MGTGINVARFLDGVNYNQVTTEQLKPRMQQKISELKTKVVERTERVATIQKQYAITDSAMVEIVSQFHRDQQRGEQRASYSNSLGVQKSDNVVVPEMAVPVGVIANLLAERASIQEERELVQKLELIEARLTNMRYKEDPNTGQTIQVVAVHELNDQELRFFGFDKK